MNKEGVILKGIGGFYYVLAEKAIYECRACGKFRKEGIRPLPGDHVSFSSPQSKKGGLIEQILPRKNQLVRPPVANIDLLMILISAHVPKPDLVMVDKMLVYANHHHIPSCIVVNKMDKDCGSFQTILAQYQPAKIQVIPVSAKTGIGMSALFPLLQHRCTCLAGQSAVGKSSLLNAMSSGQFSLQTGELSKKTERGRHTTRHSELFFLNEVDGFVVDTPGFSVLECMDIDETELSLYYPDFPTASCKYPGCLHWKEPDCAVKHAVASGTLSSARYDRYLTILMELMERRKHQYD